VVSYGQVPAAAEVRAATAVARELNLPLHVIEVDLTATGGGLLAGAERVAAGPSEEWWPFRNQLLVSVAAAWSMLHGFKTIVTGGVATDGERHADGRPEFYQRLDELCRAQEGGIGVLAPAIGLTSEELVVQSEISDAVLGWTFSCHSGALPCGRCPGCVKRIRVLTTTGRLVMSNDD
jgi:7-cyano-7-deazaguanine synthase